MGLAAFNRMRRRQAELLALQEADAQDPGSEAVLSDGSEQEQEQKQKQEAMDLDLDAVGYDELKAIAKERGIPYVGVKKDKLIEALKASE